MVRRHTVELFNRLVSNPVSVVKKRGRGQRTSLLTLFCHQTGFKFIQGLSRFQRMTYERLCRSEFTDSQHQQNNGAPVGAF